MRKENTSKDYKNKKQTRLFGTDFEEFIHVYRCLEETIIDGKVLGCNDLGIKINIGRVKNGKSNNIWIRTFFLG